jgi:hypothetical protein
MVTLDDVLTEAKKNNRICPQPDKWNELYNILPDKVREGSGWKPSLSLILAAWHDTPHLLKILRLKEHIEWAADHGQVDTIYQFLINLKEEEWYHSNE